MKYSKIVLAALMAIATGCTVEESFQKRELKEKEITIEARREGDETQTRTYREDSDGSIWWVPGDAISLFYGSGANGGSKFTSTGTDTTKVTNFTGTITAITGGAEIKEEDTYFWGLYPYQEDVSCDGSTVTMTLPKEQTAVPGTFATGLFPSIGRSHGLIMGFYNICGGMKFSVTKEGVRKVTLKSNGGEKITGKAKISFNNGTPTAEIIDGSDEIVLECPRGEYFEVGKYYFMVMFPTTFKSGFTVTLETYTEEATVQKANSITCKRSIFGKIDKLDASATYSQKTGNIPIEDANFKAYLVSNFDTNGDGEISYMEAAKIKSISTPTSNIKSVQGLEYMANLTSLDVSKPIVTGNESSGHLTLLDISNNLALKTLSCFNNQLSSLDVSKNHALNVLECSNNSLMDLDLSNNAALTFLSCDSNQLATLNVSKNTSLTSLSCSSNRITSLDISMNMDLGELWCDSNKLTTLDISKNTALTILSCSSNRLTTLDVSKNTTLVSLVCCYNQLKNLQLTAPGAPRNSSLTYLWCFSNQLTTLDVSNNTALEDLRCFDNQLESLDVTKNTALTYLDCNQNQLKSLDVSNNTALDDLRCYIYHITSIDVSKNTLLTHLDCGDNQLTTLDVSNNTAFESLSCGGNQLTTLDVSKNTLLTYLDCGRMSTLTTLFISQGQEIPNITINRLELFIPAATEIKVAVENGGGEGTGEENW